MFFTGKFLTVAARVVGITVAAIGTATVTHRAASFGCDVTGNVFDRIFESKGAREKRLLMEKLIEQRIMEEKMGKAAA